MVIVTVAHVATGALTLAASIVLAIQIRRNVTEPVHGAVGDRVNRIASFLELTKPRITCFILMSAAIGFMCSARIGHRLHGLVRAVATR